ncbi:MAG TPA: hypothetical protein VM553_11085 [Dongiaceae bacterium]|nr:hypothetical protein [Dongiaceae bacterium]
MPLTYVVEHLNRQLSDLHPASLLKNKSRFFYDNRKVSATVGSFQLEPRHFPVLDPVTGATVARDTRLVVRDSQGKEQGADILYLQAWDAADVIFLDRFIRTLHALHHIDTANPGTESLILDVHVRHLAAVPTAHGQVFEQLLDTLGLNPRQIIFRIDAELVLSMPEVLLATRNFLLCGYTLLAHFEQPDNYSLVTLGSIGFRWASVASPAATPQQGHAGVQEWIATARKAGLITLGPSDVPRLGSDEFHYRVEPAAVSVAFTPPLSRANGTF